MGDDILKKMAHEPVDSIRRHRQGPQEVGPGAVRANVRRLLAKYDCLADLEEKPWN
jgi:type I restriction enzyme, R subunit